MALKVLLHCAIFSATCLAMPLRDKLPKNCSVTWVVSQFLLLHEALHEEELGSTFRNGLQQLATPLHSVSPLQQLVSQFYSSFNKGACTHLFFVPRIIAGQQLATLHFQPLRDHILQYFKSLNYRRF